MNPLFQAGLELQTFFQSKKWSYCYIGGLAVIRWGEIRTTQDIDVVLLTDFGSEKPFIDELSRKFKSRVSDPMEFALKNRVLLLSASNQISMDISLSGIAFEKKMLERSSFFSYTENCSLKTCSAEDLVVLKAFADRPKDWNDIEGIVLRQAQKLDQKYIIQALAPLCELKENPEIVKKLKKVFSIAS